MYNDYKKSKIKYGQNAYLERLRVPLLHLSDGLHLAEVVRELIELLDTVGKPDREFLYQ